MKVYWTFAYAENAAQINLSKIKASLTDASDFKCLEEAVSSCVGWSKTLRPETTGPIEEMLATCFGDLAGKLASKEEGNLTARDAMGLLGALVPALRHAGAAAKFRPLVPKFRQLAEEEGKLHKQKALDDAFAELAVAGEEWTETLCQNLTSACNGSKGLFFSEMDLLSRGGPASNIQAGMLQFIAKETPTL